MRGCKMRTRSRYLFLLICWYAYTPFVEVEAPPPISPLLTMSRTQIVEDVGDINPSLGGGGKGSA